MQIATKPGLLIKFDQLVPKTSASASASSGKTLSSSQGSPAVLTPILGQLPGSRPGQSNKSSFPIEHEFDFLFVEAASATLQLPCMLYRHLHPWLPILTALGALLRTRIETSNSIQLKLFGLTSKMRCAAAPDVHCYAAAQSMDDAEAAYLPTPGEAAGGSARTLKSASPASSLPLESHGVASIRLHSSAQQEGGEWTLESMPSSAEWHGWEDPSHGLTGAGFQDEKDFENVWQMDPAELSCRCGKDGKPITLGTGVPPATRCGPSNLLRPILSIQVLDNIRVLFPAKKVAWERLLCPYFRRWLWNGLLGSVWKARRGGEGCAQPHSQAA